MFSHTMVITYRYKKKHHGSPRRWLEVVKNHKKYKVEIMHNILLVINWTIELLLSFWLFDTELTAAVAQKHLKYNIRIPCLIGT